ncbi:MAG: hypothetical protein JO104_07925 [Candidatus Eremiobacteraeota bacterium]|nr:hypothetical protein [Candidatus Eremiobacteraeota bacterium]
MRSAVAATKLFAVAFGVLVAGCGAQHLASSSFDGAPLPLGVVNAGRLSDLAVTDLGTGAVEVLDGSYRLIDTLRAGLNGPLGDYYDARGNLYVANWPGINVTEYDRTLRQIYTYSQDLVDPIGVTVDGAGNVYVADGGGGKPSVVVEYPQRRKVPRAACFTGLLNGGVAVDAAGDVFVSGDGSLRGGGFLREFKHGLKGCHARVLRVAFGSVGGLQVDNNGNLVVSAEFAGVVVMPPPYTSKAFRFKVTPDSHNIALTRKNDLIFIADPSFYGHQVVVATYPQGKYVTTLNGSNGLSVPVGVATYP